jgi:hypothetical protein
MPAISVDFFAPTSANPTFGAAARRGMRRRGGIPPAPRALDRVRAPLDRARAEAPRRASPALGRAAAAPPQVGSARRGSPDRCLSRRGRRWTVRPGLRCARTRRAAAASAASTGGRAWTSPAIARRPGGSGIRRARSGRTHAWNRPHRCTDILGGGALRRHRRARRSRPHRSRHGRACESPRTCRRHGRSLGVVGGPDSRAEAVASSRRGDALSRARGTRGLDPLVDSHGADPSTCVGWVPGRSRACRRRARPACAVRCGAGVGVRRLAFPTALARRVRRSSHRRRQVVVARALTRV